jgi:hypothetical protein
MEFRKNCRIRRMQDFSVLFCPVQFRCCESLQELHVDISRLAGSFTEKEYIGVLLSWEVGTGKCSCSVLFAVRHDVMLLRIRFLHIMS